MRTSAFYWACLLSLLSLICLLDSGKAQDQIETLRRVPPTMLSKDVVQIGLAEIDWQLKVISAKNEAYSKMLAEAVTKADQLEMKIDAMMKDLPVQTRLLNPAERSRLISHAMEKMLDSQLQLKTQEMQIAEMEAQYEAEKKEMSRSQKLKIESARTDADAAKAEMALAEQQFAYAKRLHEKKMISDSEFQLKETNFKIAVQKVSKAETEIMLIKNEKEMELMTNLVLLRVSMGPMKMRVKAADDFIKSFVESDSKLREIREYERRLEFAYDATERLRGQMMEIEQEALELKVLKEQSTWLLDSAKQDADKGVSEGDKAAEEKE